MPRSGPVQETPDTESEMRGDRVLRPVGRASVVALALLVISGAGLSRGLATRGAQQSHVIADSSFAGTVARLSEAPGYFDSDNLVSNETSYLHAVSKLRRAGTTGGVFVGVGPDQSFSYIAEIRPTLALMIDIRRDNLLMHLLFKALFERSTNRLEYLCRWFGVPVPADVAGWTDQPIEAILTRLDSLPRSAVHAAASTDTLLAAIARYGVPLDDTDRETIRRFHTEFMQRGLEIKFTSTGRAPRSYYPTLRELILERDLDGGQASYLATAERWAFVRSLQARDRIIPVVGNLGGTQAFPAIGREVAARGERVSALYVSNVEMYLWRDGLFAQFAETAASLPHSDRSLIIRSVFSGGFGQGHPLRVPGHMSTQLVQPLADFSARLRSGGWSSYWELVTAGNR